MSKSKHWRGNGPMIASYTCRKERTLTSIYLCLTSLQVLCSFRLVTHHQGTPDFVEFYSNTLFKQHLIAENMVTLWEKFTGFIKYIFIWWWLMNSVTLASSGLISILSYLSSFSQFFSFLFTFWLDKSLNSGLYVCKADSLLIEPQFHFFASVIFGNGGSWNICTSPKNIEI
jgi:hypothetical protein